MKVKLMTMIAAIAVLSSCTNLRYTDYGKPFDFLKAKRDVVKPQGKINPETILVENATETNEKIVKNNSYSISIESEKVAVSTESNEIVRESISTTENEIATNNTLEQEVIVENKTTTTKSKTQTTSKNTTVTPISRKVEKIVATRIEKIFPEGVSNSSVDSDVMFILCIILAFLIPPLAVYLTEGVTSRFWLNLILFIIGYSVGWYFFGGGIAFLCSIIAVVHALLIVLGAI